MKKEEGQLRNHSRDIRRYMSILLIVFLVVSQFFTAMLPNGSNIAFADISTGNTKTVTSTGSTYFIDYDNWGGGDSSSAADGDLDIGMKNQNNEAADNYDKYPIEVKFEGVERAPIEKAYIVIRANDVDEYFYTESNGRRTTVTGTGEWDRVYLSDKAEDIKLLTATELGQYATNFPSVSNRTWKNGAYDSSNLTKEGYTKEIHPKSYVGALSGQNNKWNITVLPLDAATIARLSTIDKGGTGENYVGITIHHHPDSTDYANSNWQMTLDWVQLVIDDGGKNKAEIVDVDFTVEKGKVTIDTSVLPKTDGTYSLEYNVIEKGADGVDRNIGVVQVIVDGTTGEIISQTSTVENSTIDPNKEYYVNVILTEERPSEIGNPQVTNPGEVQQIVVVSTFDPQALDIHKSGYRDTVTTFTAKDFQDHFKKVNGGDLGDALQKISILSLPDAEKGYLQFNGQIITADNLYLLQDIPTDQINNLQFVPNPDKFDGTVEFKWNGHNGVSYADYPANVIINSSPKVEDFTQKTLLGENYTNFAQNFENHYVDPGNEQLEKVQITTLPDATYGVLKLNGQLVTAGQEISRNDLAKLVFEPTAAFVKGAQVSFEWNAHDGLQYAKESATATLVVSERPVAAPIERKEMVRTTTNFTKLMFLEKYSDGDLDPLASITITTPASSDGYFYLNGQRMDANKSVTISAADLDKLSFQPSSTMTNGRSVTINYTVNDGYYNSLPSTIKITYQNAPVAQDLTYYVEEGEASHSFSAPANSSIVNSSTAGPGTVVIQNGQIKYTPPALDFIGTSSFNYNVRSGSQTSANAKINVIVQKKLNGWVGNQEGVDTSGYKVEPGQDFPLNAVSSTYTTSVVANVNGVNVPLVLLNPDSYEQDGFKKWGTTYTLPENTDPQEYTVDFVATNPYTSQIEANKIDNKFVVPEPSTPPVTESFTVETSYTEAINIGGEFEKNYQDAENDAIKEIIITPPANLSEKGTLTYTDSQGNTVTVTPGTTVTLTADEAKSLVFTPDATKPASTVEISWKAVDAKGEVSNESTITIVIQKDITPPVVDDLVKETNAKTPVSIGDLTYRDSGTDEITSIVITGTSEKDGVLAYEDKNGVVYFIAEGEEKALTPDEAATLKFIPNKDLKPGAIIEIPVKVIDQFGEESNEGKITITIVPLPSVQDKTVEVIVGGTVEIGHITAADKDGNPVNEVVITTPPSSSGSVSYTNENGEVIILPPNSEVTLTPKEADTLVFTADPSAPENTNVEIPIYVIDKDGVSSDLGTITIEILPKPVPPTVTDVTVDAPKGEGTPIGPIEASDKEGNPVTEVILTAPPAEQGTITYTDKDGNEQTIPPDEEVTLTPEEANTLVFTPDPSVPDETVITIPVIVVDQDGIPSTEGTITIVVKPEPIPPTVDNKQVITPIDQSVAIGPITASDKDGNPVAHVIVTGPPAGQGTVTYTDKDGNEQTIPAGEDVTLTPEEANTLVYTPAENASTTDIVVIPVKVVDQTGLASTQGGITIQFVERPTVEDKALQTIEGEAIALGEIKAEDENGNPVAQVVITAPPAEQGTLTYVDENGVTQVITPGTDSTLTPAEANTLVFTPNEDVPAGTIVEIPVKVIDENGFESDKGTITIEILPKPVPPTIENKALETKVDEPVSIGEISAKDKDGNPVAQIIVTAPPAEQGILTYTDQDGNVQTIVAGSDVILSIEEANKLIFTPNPEVLVGTIVEIPVKAIDSDGIESEQGLITILIKPAITHDHTVVKVVEGTPSVTIELPNIPEGATIVITEQPAKGTITITEDNQVIYTPNDPNELGEVTFAYEVTNVNGDVVNQSTVTVIVEKIFNGWVGTKEEFDPSTVTVIAGQPLTLTAASASDATEVYVTIFGELVALTLKEIDETTGVKIWENTTYVIPKDAQVGVFTPVFTVVNAEGEAKEETNLIDNKIEIVKPILTLVADPDTIVGDGISTSELTATLTFNDGTPIANVEVEFKAPANGGTFTDEFGNQVTSIIVVTDENGVATVIYTSPKIESDQETQIQVDAFVQDEERGLIAQDDITITFLPATVQGVITEGENHTPVAYATVTISLDKNGDGIIEEGVDFIKTVTTDEFGRYNVPVPTPNAQYRVEVTKTVKVGDQEVTITYVQTGTTGNITGHGNEVFDSEKTATGLITIKQADGSETLLPEAVTNQMVVRVKDADGNYLKDANGNILEFSVNEQGVYSVAGLATGKYTIETLIKVPNVDEYLVFKQIQVEITAEGEMNITSDLVDPYGTITDSQTGEIIEGAKVTLYYADTPRNRQKGIVPGTEVILPAVPNFPPYDNASPTQYTDAHGFYAYMVFAETDYYLVIEHPGYITVKSEVISVEWEIVRYDRALDPIGQTNQGGGTVTPSPQPSQPTEPETPATTTPVPLPEKVVDAIVDLTPIINKNPSGAITDKELKELKELYELYKDLTPEQKKEFEKAIDVDKLQKLIVKNSGVLPQTDATSTPFLPLTGLLFMLISVAYFVRRKHNEA